MNAKTSRAIALWSVSILATCAEHDVPPGGANVELAIAPLTLPSVVDVCYGLTVFNAPAMGEGDTVWSRAGVCAAQYGNDGGGDVAYVGPCDADTPAVADDLNYVRLVLETIEVGAGQGSLPAGPIELANVLDDQITVVTSGDGDADFMNPCPAPGGCVLSFECEVNADVPVVFNLTVMADADQGFFDVAVNFEDIFCSAKFDTCYDVTPGAERWIELLHGDDATSSTPIDGGGRDRTGVLALACTAGPDVAAAGNGPGQDLSTTLHYSDVTLSCGNGTTTLPEIALPLALPGGNHDVIVDWGAPTGSAPLQYATYFGYEDLDCDGLPCNKIYLNVAIDLEDIPAGFTCSLAAQATATHADGAPLVGGTLTRPGSNYPYVDYQIADVSACQQHPLDADGSEVTTAYASTFLATNASLQACFSYDGSDTPVANGACGGIVVEPPAATSLSTPNAPSSRFVGETLSVSSVLTRVTPPAGNVSNGLVAFTLTGPAGSTQQSGTTSGSGDTTVTFPALPNPGDYTVTAAFAGGATLLPATSGGASITVSQRTSLALPAVTGSAGDPVAVSATLTAVPGGQGIANQQVAFDFSGLAQNQSAITDGSGVATVTVTFPSAMTYPVTASFSNLAGFYVDAAGVAVPTTVYGQVTTSAVTASLSDPDMPTIAYVGDNLAASVVLQRTTPPAALLGGQNVSFTLYGTGSPSTLTTVTSGSGIASASFALTTRGAYFLQADFNGTDALSSVSSSSAVTVLERTALTLAPASGDAGSPITVSATLTTLLGGLPIAGRAVTFLLNGIAPDQTAVTDAAGVASITITVANEVTTDIGAYHDGGSGYYANSTGGFEPELAFGTLTVSSPASQLTTPTVTAQVLVGNSLTTSTTLTTAGGQPIAGASVDFNFSGPGNGTMTGQTDANGIATVTFPLTERGAHTVTAQFMGSPGVAGSSSSSAEFSVFQRTSLALTLPTVYAGQTMAVSATLRTVPDNAPLVGYQVAFDLGGAAANDSAFTDESGTATLVTNFASSNSYSVGASFGPGSFFTNEAGTLPAVATTARDSLFVMRAPTAFYFESPTIYRLVGEPLAFQAGLINTVWAEWASGAQVDMVLRHVQSGEEQTQSITTDNNGFASVSFNAPTQRGRYELRLSFAGNSTLYPTNNNSDPILVEVFQKVDIQLTVDGAPGSEQTISARLTNVPGDTPFPWGHFVRFEFFGEDEPTSVMASTQLNGTASIVRTLPPGSWLVRASINGFGSYYTSAGDPDSYGADEVFAFTGIDVP